MIVPDGQIGEEKLRQLILESEQTHLDFKATIDFTETKDRVEFVKDAVTMANRPPGGYIVVGIDDKTNQPTIPAGQLSNPRAFDGANLNHQIRKFIEGQTHAISKTHQIDGFDYVVIWIPHHTDGLPVPMKTTGQYRKDNGDDKIAFREGDILIREGAANVPLRYAH